MKVQWPCGADGKQEAIEKAALLAIRTNTAVVRVTLIPIKPYHSIKRNVQE
jgi:hypothetical protein